MCPAKWQEGAATLTPSLDLAGVFVQIGLVPNTEFMKGTLAAFDYLIRTPAA